MINLMINAKEKKREPPLGMKYGSAPYPTFHRKEGVELMY
jgi:hypothetical protein